MRTECNNLHIHKFPAFAVFKPEFGHEIHHGNYHYHYCLTINNQEPSFCSGFLQQSKDLFVFKNHLDNVMHYWSHCCR